MNITKTKEERLAILSMAARYDASCSSSGSGRPNQGGTGNALPAGICHSWSADGRCVSLLKVLLSNACTHDCAYCVNRRSSGVERASLSPDEVAEITMQFYLRNYIEGLFLSSAVLRSPDYSMELMIRAVSVLRKKHGFNGYVHMKVMPGASPELIRQAGLLADRVSANIELPSSKGLEILTPEKHPAAVMGSIRDISRGIKSYADESRSLRISPAFAPAGQSTQMIVGATPDTDRTIISLSESLYRKLALKRVYYSAFVPVNDDSRLPALKTPPLKREHRLYQADWLLRFYGFNAAELFDAEHHNLETEMDPKTAWALRNYSRFPIEINRASYEEILRVPGIGVKSAQRIIRARRFGSLGFEELKKLGVVLKRAQYFILCRGKIHGRPSDSGAIISDLTGEKNPIRRAELNAGQLSLFTNPASDIIPPRLITENIHALSS